MGSGCSINDYKNHEEQTLRDAVNSLINFTIQESELHREFATQMKNSIVNGLDEMRKVLSFNKKGWLNKLDEHKKKVKDANDQLKKDHQSFQKQTGVKDDLKRKRDAEYLSRGLKLDEEISHMPPTLKLAEQKYQEALVKMKECEETRDNQQKRTESETNELNTQSQKILNQIEDQEYRRLAVLSEGLSKFSLAVGNLVQQSDSLHKLLEMECSVVDPVKDVQMFIAKNSTFADNDRLKNLYKQLGVYKPLGHAGGDEAHPTDPKSIISSGLLVDKSSRSMAQQLKQMEENRKKKVIEEEQQRREQAKMKKVQVLVDGLKGTREMLYRLGSKAMGGTLDRWLVKAQTNKALESQASIVSE